MQEEVREMIAGYLNRNHMHGCTNLAFPCFKKKGKRQVRLGVRHACELVGTVHHSRNVRLVAQGAVFLQAMWRHAGRECQRMKLANCRPK
jgi:hypothetical protein